MQTGWHTGILADKQTWVDRPTDTYTDRSIDKETYRQLDRQTHIEKSQINNSNKNPPNIHHIYRPVFITHGFFSPITSRWVDDEVFT